MEKLLIKSVIPIFGGNRYLAPEVGRLLDGCEWVGIPFCGSLAELLYISAREVNANDLHKHIINLVRTMADPMLGPALYRRLRRRSFHPCELIQAQRYCLEIESDPVEWDGRPNLVWAEHYFICAWMARSGAAGTKGEFKAQQSIRWNSSGGGSASRFSRAVLGIPKWRRLLERVTFTCLDAFAFLAKCKDQPKHGIYCDPPFPGPGDLYKHAFDNGQQRRLSRRLSQYKKCKIVCRFYDVPLIRELYPNSKWTWHRFAGRKQTNEIAPEVLLTLN